MIGKLVPGVSEIQQKQEEQRQQFDAFTLAVRNEVEGLKAMIQVLAERIMALERVSHRH